MEIAGKKTLITGAASGIGKATALAMAERGARLFITDINAHGLEETRREVEGKGAEVCFCAPLDVSDYDAVRKMADEIHAGSGPLDILANIAGVALFSQVEDMIHEQWERIVNVNLWGPYHAIECFVPEMVRAGNGGHVLLVSSTAGIIGLPWHVAYAGTKHALVGSAEVLRYDLRKHGIGVSVILPGAVNTGLVRTVVINADEDACEKGRRLFSRHAMAPERVADLIIGAIERNKFMVITSMDIKLLYLLKRTCPPIYCQVLRFMTWFLDRTLTRDGMPSRA
ncbi:MAG: SDR family oxidoreductase [Actinomycetota bacterium]|nr:SDR family oxidoreductase [Actinomycetota bacterium]MDD5666055.1 SDR family oxidoreductase [Actinomycetota bacterium]